MAFGPELYSKPSPGPIFATSWGREEGIGENDQCLFEAVCLRGKFEAVKVTAMARLYNRVDDVLLAGKVAVDRAGTKTAGVHHVLQRGFVKTAFRKATERGIDDLLAPGCGACWTKPRHDSARRPGLHDKRHSHASEIGQTANTGSDSRWRQDLRQAQGRAIAAVRLGEPGRSRTSKPHQPSRQNGECGQHRRMFQGLRERLNVHR